MKRRIKQGHNDHQPLFLVSSSGILHVVKFTKHNSSKPENLYHGSFTILVGITFIHLSSKDRLIHTQGPFICLDIVLTITDHLHWFMPRGYN
jgi:hypothetical protein